MSFELHHPCQHVKVLVRFLVPTNSIKYYNKSPLPSALSRCSNGNRACLHKCKSVRRTQVVVCVPTAWPHLRKQKQNSSFHCPGRIVRDTALCRHTHQQQKKCKWCKRQAIDTDVTWRTLSPKNRCFLGSLLSEQHCVVFSHDEKVVTGEITTNQDVGGRQ